jgi:hypothetical protein
MLTATNKRNHGVAAVNTINAPATRCQPPQLDHHYKAEQTGQAEGRASFNDVQPTIAS